MLRTTNHQRRNALSTGLSVVLLTILAAGANPAQAVTILAAGSNIDLGSGWRTSSVAKSDIDGNNVLGTDGYRIVGTNARLLTPTYLTNTTQSGNVFGGNAGYALIDDPNTTPGGGPTTIRTGTTNPFAGANTEASVFTFTAKNNAPQTFRLAVLVDNTDGTPFTSSSLRILQTAGGAATSTSVNTSTVNRNPDWYYFDIVGAQAGDTFSVLSGGGSSGCNCVGGIAFDNSTGPIAIDPTKLWSVDIQGTGSSVSGQSNPPLSFLGVEGNYGLGNVWNAFAVPGHTNAAATATAGLVDSNGNASPVVFTINRIVSPGDGATDGVTGWGGSGTSGGLANLTRDYLFVGTGVGNATTSASWEISGLLANVEYELYAYGGISRDMLLTVDNLGVSQLVNGTGFLFQNVFADQFGRITGRVANGTGDAEGDWAGFQLRQIGVVIPEPATMSLLALAGAAMLRRRRRA